jgi:hypothetical protein
MQFFHMRDDESKNWRNYLVIQLGKEEFDALKTRFDSQVPRFSCWAIIRKGNPYIVFEYGGTICLSESFGSGETLGDKLTVGDVVTVILTDKPQDQLFVFANNTLDLKFSLEEVIAYPLTYTEEMEQIYDFYLQYAKIKDNKREITLKNKSKRLGFR